MMPKFRNHLLLLLGSLSFSESLLAAGDGPYFSYYKHVVHMFTGLSDSSSAEQLAHWRQYEIVPGILLATILIFIGGLIYSKWAKAKLANNDFAPPSKISLVGMVELLMNFVVDLTRDTIGKGYEKFTLLLSTLFVFILINNISGLVPGLPPATENISTNFALGLVVFVVYNWAGFKEHGVPYVKHFMGPFLILAPMFIIIELISHGARPFSLALRLYANLFGDHTVVGIFTELTGLVAPAFLLLFGLMVACIQSFIFVLLSGIYIEMARSHDH